MKKSVVFTIVIVAIVITAICFIVWPPFTKPTTTVDSTSTSTSAQITTTTTTTPSTVVVETEQTVEEDDYKWVQSVHRYCSLIDEKKFFDSYVEFLEESLELSNANELNTEFFQAEFHVYAGLSEGVSCEPLHYGNVVYFSWQNIWYCDYEFFTDNGFTNDFANVIENEIRLLKAFAENPTEENSWTF